MLRRLLADFCPMVEVVGQAGDIKSGVEAVRTHQPDLLFLDIQMPSGSGFDLLKHVSDMEFEVIFTTAHQNFALQAFRVSALDYLLKPIEPDLLVKAVEKAQQRMESGKGKEDRQNSINSIKGMQLKQVAFPTLSGLEFVKPENIVRCEADSNYTTIVFSNGNSLVVSKTLSETEVLLESFPFFRLHRSHLVNLDHIVKYIKGKNGFVMMSDGTQVEISKRRKEAFLELFKP